MLKEEKRRELDALVGKQNADALIQNMLSREKSAQRQGVAFKALDPIALDDINEFANVVSQSMEDEVAETANYKKKHMMEETMEATAEKCSPGTKDGKYSAKEEKAEDDDMDMEETDMEENDMEESLLTENEIGMIADEVAKRLSTSMDEMKGMMSNTPKRTKSDDDAVELAATFKAFTESQESFAAAMVDALEALDTRLKELSEAKSTFSPSATHKNVVVDKDGNMAGLNEVEQAAYRMWFQNQ
jgi:hypothetical protein